MVEVWKTITGYEGLYEVSSFGRVRSLTRYAANTAKSVRLIPGQIIAPYARPESYHTVKLAKDGVKENRYVHRLVTEAFHGPSAEGDEVLHKNGDKSFNAETNLCWGSRLDNMTDRTRLNEHANGERHGHAKLLEVQVRAIRADPRAQIIVAKEYGVSRRLVGMIKARQVWKHLTDIPSN